MSRILVIKVASQETGEELSRWETLLSQATAQGVHMDSDEDAHAAFKQSLCEAVCKDLWEEGTDPFVSRDQFWLSVHLKAARMWLGEGEANRLAAKWNDKYGKINFWCGEFGERPCSHQYAEHWIQERKWVTKKKLDGEILKAMADDSHRVEVPQGSIGNEQQLLLQPPTQQWQQQEGSWAVVVDGRDAKQGDVTPVWDNSATDAVVVKVMQKIFPDDEYERRRHHVAGLPQRAWAMSLGTTWEEMGQTLRSASHLLGSFPDRDGDKTPLFQLQLRLNFMIDGGQGWMGELSLRWDTRGAYPRDRTFLWIQLYHAAKFFRTYIGTLQHADEEGAVFPRMDRCASWAIPKFDPMLEEFELSDAAEIEKEWAAGHFQFDPEELASMLLDCLDDEIPAAVQDYIANVAVEHKLKTLTDWVMEGGWDHYPIKGARNQLNRLRWAWLAARDTASAVYQARYVAARRAMEIETDERSAQLSEHLTQEVGRFVDGNTVEDWSNVMSEQQRKEVVETWGADFRQRLINSG